MRWRGAVGCGAVKLKSQKLPKRREPSLSRKIDVVLATQPSFDFNLGRENTRIGSASTFHGVRKLRKNVLSLLVTIKRKWDDWRL